MKSHPYASRRRLTNICCLIASLGIIKFIFATYFLAGGELFEFTATRELSPKASIIAQEQKQIAMNLQVQASPNNASQNNNVTQNDFVAQNTSATQSGNAGQLMENINPVSNSRVSFLPKGQKSDMNHKTRNQTTGNTPSNSQGNTPANIPNEALANMLAVQNVSSSQATPASQASSQASTQVPAQAFTSPVNTSPVTPVEPLLAKMANEENSILAIQTPNSDIVTNDSMFAQASSATASIARSQRRANLLQNAFRQNFKNDADALEGIETQQSNYNTQNLQSKNNIAKNNTAKSKKGSSFFSFVGTAHAEEVYIRPDENINIPIPTPKVSPYSSPESLEYKQSELNRKEEELIALQQQMSSRMEELNALEGRIGTMVQNANTAQDGKYQHLIGTYTSMKAKKAAETLVTLEEEIAVRILNGMKPKQSGEIFSYMDSVQAARLSEAMADLNM